MTVLELTRKPEDRRLYALEGVDTVRLEGPFSNSATAEARRRGWRFTRRFTSVARYAPSVGSQLWRSL